jgi:E3 ubiquitin-protein ligase UBR7
VCYACSVQCHGEHTLVEIFAKRNFTCDCGTTRYPATSPCSLRINPETNTRGGVHSEIPDANNKYNQNFRNRFCACVIEYDPFQQKGTMFQCMGLGTHETGGCGEDWYHPGCLVGLGPKWFENMPDTKKAVKDNFVEYGTLPTISEDGQQQAAVDSSAVEEAAEEDDPPLPPGFPGEDDFESFLCYKCVDAHPWIKRYAGTPGFLAPLFLKEGDKMEQDGDATANSSKKRKAEDDMEVESEVKRVKNGDDEVDSRQGRAGDAVPIDNKAVAADETPSGCKYALLPPAPEGQFSLFFKEGFRDHICRCSSCYPNLNPHPQLLEEEEVYEPPMSEDGSENGGSTHGSGSLYERGESALRNVDRVRAIEGVMAYNHLKEQLKPFFQQFADSGKAIGAEDIKAYFAKLRGDEQGIRDAGEAASSSSKRDGDGDGDGDGDDFRREQSGY